MRAQVVESKVMRGLSAAAVLAASIFVPTEVALALAPSPVVSVAPLNPTPAPFIGDAVPFTVTFDNLTGADTGFGPYVDLKFLVGGADGNDGLDFVDASFLGTPLAPLLNVVCTGAAVVHPLTLASVPCPVGQRLVVLQLPFGSFTEGQPPAVISVNTKISPLADAGIPLTLSAVPGFAYGNSATGSPPGIVGATATGSVTPQLVTFNKTYVGLELETATGPNYPRKARLSLDIATGAAVTSVQLRDALPPSWVFLGVTASSPGGVATSTPTVGAPQVAPNNSLVYTFTGGPVGVPGEDRFVEFQYYVNNVTAPIPPGANVINPSTGDDVNTRNNGSAAVTITPADPRDAPVTTTINPNVLGQDDFQLVAKSIAVQKGVALTTDQGTAGVSPNDTLTYTIQGQVSDYFTFNQVVVNDVLGDGQFLVPGSATISFTERGAAVAGVTGNLVPYQTVNTSQRAPIVGGTGTCGNGTTGLAYNVSNAYAALGGANGTGGIFTGGRVGGTTGPATFTITFKATVDDIFGCVPGVSVPLKPNDRLSNNVTLNGQVLDNVTQAPQAVAQFEADDSSTSIKVPGTTISKSIYARNGVLGSGTDFAAGDRITYRIQYTIPNGDTDSLVISDYLPLPVLTAAPSPTGITAPINTQCAAGTAPASGKWCYGPANNTLDPTVAVSADAAANAIRWDYGAFDDPTNQTRTVDILFTKTISIDPFRDGLQLTNQVQAESKNSFGEPETQGAIVQFKLSEPVLRVRKGIVDTNSPTESFSGTQTPTGVSFSAAGTPGCAGRIASGSPITSAKVGNTTALLAPDADVSNVDAADIVRHAIIVENTGSGLYGAFDAAIRDTIPAGYRIPAGGLNLCVINGAGTALPNTATGFFTGTPTAGPNAGTITLTDTPLTGALAPGKTPAGVVNATGTNIMVVTYDLQLDPSTTKASSTLTNTVDLTGFSATDAGPNFIALIPAANKIDVANVVTRSPSIVKDRTGTDQTHTVNGNVVVGEIVTYTVKITVPEGTTAAAVLSDNLPAGLGLVSIDSLTASAGIATTPALASVLANARTTAAGNKGTVLTLNFGDIVNSTVDNTIDETITLVYRAVVRNVAANQEGSTPTNNAVLNYTGGTINETEAVVVREPVLSVAKSVSPLYADENDTVTYTIVVNHAGSSPVDAFNVSISDNIPAAVTYVAGTLAVTGTAPTTLSLSGTTISGTWTTFPTSASTVITYQAVVNSTGTIPNTTPNTATVKYTSLPGTATDLSPWITDGSDSERGGDGGVNDYVVSSTATLRSSNPTINKALISTSEPSTTDPNVTIGETVVYELSVKLPEGNNAAGFNVADVVPAGMQYVPGSAVVNSAGFGGVLPAPTISGGASDGDDVIFSFGPTVVTGDNSPANDGFTIRVTLRVLDVPGNVGVPPTQTNLVNTATVAMVGGGVIDSNPVATPVVEPKLAITKTVNPLAALQGDQITVTLAVTNNGLSTSFDTIVEDVFDTKYDISTLAFATTAATFAPSLSGRTVRYTGGTLAPGETATFTLTVNLVSPLPAGTLVPNTTTVIQATTLPDADPGGRNEPPVSDDGVVNVVAPDLTLSKDDGVASLAVGAGTTYTLTVRNVGGAEATGVTITDTLPAGLTFVSVGGAGCSATGTNPVTIAVAGTIAPNGSVGCTMTVAMTTPVAAGTQAFTNNASVVDDGTHGADLTPGNNSDADTDTITGLAPNLNVVKDDGLQNRVPGETYTYTITATNTGNVGVTNAFIQDSLPTGVTFISCVNVSGVVAAGGDCAAVANIVTSTYEMIAGAGGSARFTITVRVDNPVAASISTVTNQVTITDDGANGADADPTDNADSDTDVIIAQPDMRIVKTADTATSAPGGAINYSLQVSNSGLQDATGVTVTDTLPAGLTVTCSSVVPTPTSCSAQSITWGPALGDTGVLSAGAVFTSGTARTLTYTAVVVNPVAAGTTQFRNVATVADDGANGADPTPGNNTDDEVVTLTGAAPDLSITKTDNDVQTLPGDTQTYTLVVTNNGNIGSTNVVITDVLPATQTFGACPSITVGAATVNCDATNAPTITWTIPLLAGAGDSATLTYTASVNSPAAAGVVDYTNIVTVADDGANGVDPTPADNTASDTDTLTAAPDLWIVKNDGVQTRTPGEPYAYTLTVTNSGDQDATKVVVTDTLPATLVFVSCPAVTTNAGAVVCTRSGQVLTWSIASVTGGATLTPPPTLSTLVLTVNVTVVASVPDGVTSILNTTSVADDGLNGADPTPDNNADSDTDTLAAVPDMTIAKDDGRLQVDAGDEFPSIYKLTVRNVGTQTATGVVVTDTLPPGVTFVSCVPTCDSSALPVLTWTNVVEDHAGSISDPAGFDPAGVATLTVTVTIDALQPDGRTSLTNNATVSDDGTNGADPTPDDNQASDTDVLVATPDLKVTKTDGKTHLEPGQSTTYAIVATNVGNQAATGVVVTDTLPAGVEFVSCTATCDSSAAPSIVWPVGTLAGGGESVTLTITVTVTSPVAPGTRTFANVVSVADDGANGTDPTLDNNTATDVDTYGVDLAVTKTDNVTTVVPGQRVSYTVTVSNLGPSPITEFTLIEQLPAALQGVTFTPSVGSYNAGTGLWTSFGTFTEGQSFTLAVEGTVDPAAVGDVVNVVTVSPPVGFTDPVPSNDKATDADTTSSVARLSLTKTRLGELVGGQPVSYTLTVTNNGPSVARDVVLVDNLPAGLTLVSMTGTGWTCVAERCALDAPLAPGVSASVTLIAKVVGPPGSTVTNTAQATTSTPGVPGGLPTEVVTAQNTGKIPTLPIDQPLPQTGSDPEWLFRFAFIALLAGSFSLLVARRRRRMS